MGILDVFTSIRNRAEKFLNEKNVVTDLLGKAEEKTGIKKKIIALSMKLFHDEVISYYSYNHLVYFTF